MARAHEARLALPSCKRANRWTLLEHSRFLHHRLDLAHLVQLLRIIEFTCILSCPIVYCSTTRPFSDCALLSDKHLSLTSTFPRIPSSRLTEVGVC